MHSRFHRNIAALIAAQLVLGGCVQMTRHSNTMLFGTNTSLGLKVGTDATSVPGILVGYNRQEAVVLPLVANTASRDVQGGKSNVLEPCNVGNEVKVVQGTPPPPAGKPLPIFVTHPCLLVASNDEEGAKDSYSVLASFGANFGAAAQKDEVTAQGGLAQYFATGMAAQLLALNGGAAVVATGEAATKSAEGDKVTLDGVVLTSAERAQGEKDYKSYEVVISDLVDKIKTKTPDGKLKENIDDFELKIGSKSGYGTKCKTTSAECGDLIKGRKAYLDSFIELQETSKFEDAVKSYPTKK